MLEYSVIYIYMIVKSVTPSYYNMYVRLYNPKDNFE